ncbi:NUDIX hydrolase YfcD [Endozoicomonadaceae bacterium StTr2]
MDQDQVVDQAPENVTDTEEMVTIVDDANRVTGSAPRSVMRREKLCHRATYIFVFDHQGQLYQQLRTTIKDVYPGWYDLAAGGVVTAGEDYDTAAERELEEELGISSVPLESCFHFYFQNDDCRVWGKVFCCTYEGEMKLQPEEVVSVSRISPEKVLANPELVHYTPDTLAALQRLMKYRQQSS